MHWCPYLCHIFHSKKSKRPINVNAPASGRGQYTLVSIRVTRGLKLMYVEKGSLHSDVKCLCRGSFMENKMLSKHVRGIMYN